MLFHSSLSPTETQPATILTGAINHQTTPMRLFKVSLPGHYRTSFTCLSTIRSTVPVLQGEGRDDEEKQVEASKVKWVEIGPDITDEQKQAMAELPSKMTKRCKALMKQIICCSSQEGNLPLLLAAWVKVMRPKRADWLSVIKEMKSSENPLLIKVLEYALLEDSFEANIRDYTKMINAFAKQNRLQDAESAFLAMKRKGFTPDIVTSTVLIHMYSKAGNFDRAREVFEEIRLLALPLDKRAYGSMIMAYIRAGMPGEGEMLLREMDALETHPSKEVYKALLRAYSTLGKSDGAQRVFDAIQLAGIVPDAKICALLINAYCVAGQSDDARSVLENMRSAGIKPNDKCVALMLASFQKENTLEKAVVLLMDLERDGIVIGKEASDVLREWCHKLGISDELEHALQVIYNSPMKI